MFGLMLYFKYSPSARSPAIPTKTFIETPLPLLTVMFFLAGVQSILMGVLAEMVMRTYYESQSKTTYLLGEVRQGAGRRRPVDARDRGRCGPRAMRSNRNDAAPVMSRGRVAWNLTREGTGLSLGSRNGRGREVGRLLDARLVRRGGLDLPSLLIGGRLHDSTLHHRRRLDHALSS